MNPQNNSAWETVPGLHPDYYSRIPNRLTAALLRSLKQPWPDAAVWLYLYSLVGFGCREFAIQTRDGRRFFIELEPGEFICSVKKLAELSGRNRRTLMKIIAAVAVEVRRTHKGGWPVYRLKPELEPVAMQNPDRAETPDISQENAVIHNHSPQGTENAPPATQNLHRVEKPDISQEKAVINSRIVPLPGQKLYPLEREYREKRKERKGVDNSSKKKDHAAHDPKERRSGKAVKLGNCLQDRNEQRKPTVSKERAMQILAEVRHKLPGDQLLALMRRYGITRPELDAACAQLSCEL
jgi:hypothetical protein